MALPSLYFFIFYLFFDGYVVLGQVLQNTTIDDRNPAIRYTGYWHNSSHTVSSVGGSHTYTQDPNAQVTFNFTGVAVYLLSPFWPYAITAQVQLDSRSPETLVLRDLGRPDTGGGNETVGSHVVWSAEGLANGQHRLIMGVGTGEQWAVVDGFIVTSVNESTTATQSVTPTPLNPSSTPPSPSPSRNKNVLVIGLLSAIGFLVLVIVALISYYSYRQRRNRPRELRVNLEEEFPFISRSPPVLSIPPFTPTLNVNSPTSPETVLVVQSPEQEYYTMVPFTTPPSRNTLASSSVTAPRRNIRGKPPSYDESVTAHRRARREVLRKSRSVVSNPD